MAAKTRYVYGTEAEKLYATPQRRPEREEERRRQEEEQKKRQKQSKMMIVSIIKNTALRA